jgi:hypothetical protein
MDHPTLDTTRRHVELTTGSRDWTDRAIIHDALVHLPSDVILVNGGQMKILDRAKRIYSGADCLVSQYALVHGLEIHEEPADWSQGLGAGPRRNREMYARWKPDHVTAFRLSGKSAGTDHMVKVALDGGTPVKVYFLHEGNCVILLPETAHQYEVMLGCARGAT